MTPFAIDPYPLGGGGGGVKVGTKWKNYKRNVPCCNFLTRTLLISL